MDEWAAEFDVDSWEPYEDMRIMSWDELGVRLVVLEAR